MDILYVVLFIAGVIFMSTSIAKRLNTLLDRTLSTSKYKPLRMLQEIGLIIV